MDYKIVKQVVSVSKEEYIEYWENRLKEMKTNLIYFKVKTTKEIISKEKRIIEIIKELNELK